MEVREATKAESTPVPELEAQEHEGEFKSNPEADIEASAQECVERGEQAVEPSEVVDTLEEGVTEEVGLTLLERL